MSDPGSKAAKARKFHGTVRALVFALALAFMVASPFVRQFLGVKTHHLRAWVMFSGIGLGAMDVRFYERHPDGSQAELDPFVELGMERPKKVQKRRLQGTRAVWQVASKICKRRGAGMDLRVLGRRATKEGWVQDFNGKVNLCEFIERHSERPKRGRERRR